MDTAWDKTASLYGFQCNGCDESCCETEFYHHTLIEKTYLLHGLSQMPPPAVIAAKKRAQKVCTKRNIATKKGGNIRVMCPLNQDGKCIIYRFRPMICRLHGIPHELSKFENNSMKDPLISYKPGALTSPGCKAGSELFSSGYIPFNRTPFYMEMAEIEKEYQKSVGTITRNRQTIAQMLIK
ncbi:MAG: hypothetical protein HQK62_13525 [Desulfamplus sp.]|nr:hypothetical protein [Desulfamplus sp.]